jgi:hypothetical protein
VFRLTTTRSDSYARHAFRAVIWVNSRYRATQIDADSYDVAAVIIHLKDRDLLLVAGYEARVADTEASRKQDLVAMLRTLETTVRKARQATENG